jgi:hypothetical protein
VGEVVQEYKKSGNGEKAKYSEGSFKQSGLSNGMQINIFD